VNQFYVQRPGAVASKHVYAGTTRIASKLVRAVVGQPFEKDLFFYHPDHLGSTSYVTDVNAKVYEHIEYFPFGESWVAENNNQQRTPYLFTAKEFDEETGLYYFGARYYDPRTSVWQSADRILATYLPKTPSRAEEIIRLLPPTVHYPLARFDLPGKGGVYESRNLALYGYSHLNPLRYLDPDGNVVEVSEEMKPIVENLRARSPSAAEILNRLHKEQTKYYIRAGSDPSGGSTQPIPSGAQPSVFERMLGKQSPPENILITINSTVISQPGYSFVDIAGQEFHPSVERVLGHELGHAFIWTDQGPVQFRANQTGAVGIENRIARELNPNAPLRHPTQGHGFPAWLR
jgi:RHS repeat-associated protein